MRGVVLSARRYQFKDDSGRQVEGVSVSYVDPEDEVQQDADRRGLSLLTVNAPLATWEQLGEVPGEYLMDFRQRPGPRGRPTLQLVGVQLVGKAEVQTATV